MCSPIIGHRFQFHKGTIKTEYQTAMKNAGDFNSIKVRLKQLKPVDCYPVAIAFQFHKGTIKTSSTLINRHSLRHFNSIKVRLKRNQSAPVSALICYFNSIKVRLKLAGAASYCQPIPFQFHKGTIKTGGMSSGGGCLLNFNSIKVRLKLVLPTILIGSLRISIP